MSGTDLPCWVVTWEFAPNLTTAHVYDDHAEAVKLVQQLLAMGQEMNVKLLAANQTRTRDGAGDTKPRQIHASADVSEHIAECRDAPAKNCHRCGAIGTMSTGGWCSACGREHRWMPAAASGATPSMPQANKPDLSAVEMGASATHKHAEGCIRPQSEACATMGCVVTTLDQVPW